MKPLLALLMLLAPDACPAQADDPVLSALSKELDRDFQGLKNAEKVPLYYLGFELRDVREERITARFGALMEEASEHSRTLDADARVGDRKFDNTHQVKGQQGYPSSRGAGAARISSDDDEASIRADAWLRAEGAFKEAVSDFTKVLANKAVTAEEEDKSDDFSVAAATAHYGPAGMPAFDPALWRGRVRGMSAALKECPFAFDSGAHLSVRTENRYLLSSEGTRVVTGNPFVRLVYWLDSRTEDGMDLRRFRSYDGAGVEDLPPEDRVLADIAKSVSELSALRKGVVAEPFSGPAILRNRAAAVFFHEILGHRLESHRLKLETQGQTFKKMVGRPVTASFITVRDDPTLGRFRGTFLRGAYLFDDEGVPARPATLIENGILKGFLCSRSPIQGFPDSNGHGRRSSGNRAGSRMGNTLVEASQSVPAAALRERLVAEIRRQGKPYGLVFEDIRGGFTQTGTEGPQSFKVLPLLVYRVYPDGRPDEAVRGADIVGTPLTVFTKIIAAGDDPDVFNGNCGAETGWIPVSSVSPSLLVSEIEVEKTRKSLEKPPILPLPFHDSGAK